jgi:hypothetical protein
VGQDHRWLEAASVAVAPGHITSQEVAETQLMAWRVGRKPG